MDPSFALTLQIVITVVAGITAQVIAEYLKVPSIVFLLIFGIALGSDGWEILHPQSLGIGLEVLVALSVAIILFEGGLSLSGRELGRVSGSLRNLVTLGTSITLIGGGMAAHWLGEFPWPIAFLYASLVVVTGPTVIGPLLKQVAVDRRVATLLEGEGVLIDPVGAILAVVVLNTIIDSHARPMEIITGLTLRLGIGAAIGIAGGGLLSFIIKTCNFLTFELKNLVVLAGVWGLFGLSQFSRSESGLMAVVMAGIVLKAAAVPDERLLRRFKGQLTTLCVSVLFILLAADLSIASVIALGWGSVLTVLVLMLVVRPLSVALCTLKSDLNWRHKLFIAWVAPRGIVSASVASLFAILLTRAGINGGEAIKALVFLTILMTVFIQGLTARWVAKGLKITSSAATGAVIVGCNPLGRLIGCLFQEQGENVVLIDTDARACQQAKEEGLTVLQSSGLDTKILQEAGIESMGTFLVLTNNSEVNLVLAQRAGEEFHPPRVLAAFAGTPNPDKNKVNQVFLPSFSVKEWNQYLDDNQIKLGKTIFKGNDLSEQQTRLTKLIENGELLPLLLRRDNSLQVVTEREEWRKGDELIYILRDLRPQLLKRLSGTVRTRLSLEILPEVEIATSR
ncbi:MULTISPECIES: sodium:proton antiporter [unclassified Microcystis]|jgi:NhaP-type Na+/H+ or K+/H+ antiporter|uniref:Sodium:proton antiporter n=1 Tax=Microcystis flos-aquae Mf_QC_C_20070823_S10D TaxID=2486236 RepID=A0A552KZJ7_9CHRO|nr:MULTISPECIES: sodium:proton antiporter [unclassified Microcystis]MCA2818793.1 cation:proton antiporter [Microcystis sp. M085S1]MCA2855155.1 cation:proton antiporter [Microcystis sp. M065S1]TRT96880.1 MAG: sodium:proton antiporter [Microcystis flos-aquae Ma_QC_C_20070823_S18D]TRV13391.1 MAG: sodium:proton antiporter [Microcystis flos-aquae Mf_QC_C_20070823_S10D]TRV25796.1 MAG: sodium:proton antiporter [Microcystis flos-aquae Mf_QC_C_20070823_S10]TRV33034.1 MAG: sodium:proton antiporter [Mic